MIDDKLDKSEAIRMEALEKAIDTFDPDEPDTVNDDATTAKIVKRAAVFEDFILGISSGKSNGT